MKEVNQRALKAAKQQALALAAKAINIYTFAPPSQRTWQNLEEKLGVQIPDIFKSRECNYVAVRDFGNFWVQGFEERLKAQLKVVPQEQPTMLTKETECYKMGEVSLTPEQHSAFERTLEVFWRTKSTKAVLQDGATGIGKTFYAAAVIHYALTNNLHADGFHPYAAFLIITRKGVMEHWSRILERCGLGKYLGNQIVVTCYPQLSATYGQVFATEEFDPYKDKNVLKFNPAMVPYLVVFDECHALGNPETYQTRFAISLNTTVPNPPYQIFMSATPFVTVMNTKAWILATKAKFMGMTVTEDNFRQFAGLITNEPDKPNLAAAKRLRELFSPYIISMPKVKWPHKAINQTMVVDFHKPEDKIIYEKAFARYLEKCQKLGKNTDFGPFERLVAFGQFRKAVEPLRSYRLAELADQAVKEGYAPLIGCAFRETVIRVIFYLLELGYKREDISVIWGGKEEIKQELILTPAQIDDLVAKAMTGTQLSRRELKALQTTMAWKEDRENYQETEAQQIARHAKLAELGLLGHQSDNKRQIEIDRFQEGLSKICVFTLAAGGIGLSLDHWREGLRPRRGYFTPTYSGPEVQQALGRAMRRTTLSDVYQWLVYMRGTIEEWHVAPLIDKKLKCIAAFTKQLTIVDIGFQEKVESTRLRTKEEAEKDAESEESQLIQGETPEDEDD